MEQEHGDIREFGRFRLDTRNKLLWYDGEPVPVPLKELELLCVLVERSGELVTKDELLNTVWEDEIVEESNLTRHIYLLRKKLRKLGASRDLIENIPRRGYRFTGDVTAFGDELFVVKRRTTTRAVIEIDETDDPYYHGEGAKALHSEGQLVPLGPSEAIEVARGAATPGRSRPTFMAGIVVLMLTGAVAVAYLLLSDAGAETPTTSPPEIRSIAVLPFKTIGGDSEHEYVGPGMTEALVIKLSRVKQLSIRTADKGSDMSRGGVDPGELGRRLKVDALLHGSIQMDGERVRVAVRLVQVRDGSSLWAETFDDRFTNILDLQDSISERVIRSLRLELSGSELVALRHDHTASVEAFQLYQKGRFFWNKRSREGFLKAIELFEESISIDPKFALPYTGLADSYHLLGDYGFLAPEESILKAKGSAIKALEIDDLLGEAHTSLAYAQFLYDWDWEGAERSFTRAIELNPNYATARQWYGEYLLAMGRTEAALEQIEAARGLDPQSPALVAVACWMMYVAREYERAIRNCENALEMDPNFYPAHFWIGQAAEMSGDLARAITSYETALSLAAGSYEVMASLARALALSARQPRSREILEKLRAGSREKYVSPYLIALVHTGLGETREAIRMLELGLEDRSRAMPFLNVDPMMDIVRNEASFSDLLRQMKHDPAV